MSSSASGRSAAGGWTPVHLVLLLASLEVAINRVAVPMLRPAKGLPPLWHTALDYVGLFLFYFTGTLAAFLIGEHVARQVQTRRVREILAAAGLAIAGGLAAVPLVVAAPAALSFPLELAFGIAVVLVVASGLGRNGDLGTQIGLVALALPLLIHTFGTFGATYLWPETADDGPALTVQRVGVIAVAAVALFSPYIFAPRPFARAATRPGPVVVAMALAAVGAVIARMSYAGVARGANLAIGIELNPVQPDPRLALYLLSLATLTWTLVSCAFATSAARRRIGMGIALVVLGGYGFRWPNHYLLPLLGMSVVASAARRVRDEELADMPFITSTPAIADAAWSAYVGNVKAGLERTLASVHSLTSRGDGTHTTSVIVGDAGGMPVRTRIERLDSCVVALDVTLGREIEEIRGATYTLWAIQPRGLGTNPAPPPAAPLFKTNDSSFDERFKARGNRPVFERMVDEGLRARAAATLDGWLAYWETDGLRYRVYPGRGSPLDHPMPLSDLALGRGASAERLVAIVELLVEIARRGVKIVPAELADAPPDSFDEVDKA